MITRIEYVDYGAQGEYGLFGKVVVTSLLDGTETAAERAYEVEKVLGFFGHHLVPREVEEIPAVDRFAPVTDAELDAWHSAQEARHGTQ